MTTSDRWAKHPLLEGGCTDCGHYQGAHVDHSTNCLDCPCLQYRYELKLPDDVVNHPPHYNSHPSGVECITIAEHMNYCLGNAVKYIWRAGLKGEALEDLRKAQFYIAREIDRIERSVSVTETDGAKNHG